MLRLLESLAHKTSHSIMSKGEAEEETPISIKEEEVMEVIISGEEVMEAMVLEEEEATAKISSSQLGRIRGLKMVTRTSLTLKRKPTTMQGREPKTGLLVLTRSTSKKSWIMMTRAISLKMLERTS